MNRTLQFAFFGIGLVAASVGAQTPAASGPVVSFTATTANVTGAPDSIRIDILRWSTDAERDKLMSAWDTKGQSNAPARASGRGGAPGGRGAGARGGRGGARGGSDNAPPPTSEGGLADALQQAATVGYLWSSEVAGYALRYAGKVAGPDGADRIILITDRRLGSMNNLWKPTGQEPPSTYAFSVIELHVNAKGEGEGKISLTGGVAPDPAAKIVALENYTVLPVVLSHVKRRRK